MEWLKQQQLLAGLLLILVPLIIWARDYIQPGLGLWIGLVILPFSLANLKQDQQSQRYVWWGLVLSCLHLLLGNKMLLFMAAFCFMLWLVEGYKGKVGYLPLIVGFLLTPFLTSWMNTFTFPLRMFQSEQIGNILSRLGMKVEVQGNRFLIEGYGFLVEDACLGIHTLTFSLLLTSFILSLSAASADDSLLKLGAWYGGAFILALMANFIRTMILVLFRSPPDTLGHELVGILSVITFVGVPLLGVTQLVTHRQSGAHTPKSVERNLTHQVKWTPLLLATIVGSFLLHTHMTRPVPSNDWMLHMDIPTLEKAQIRPDVAQFRNEEILLYVKAPCSPWRSDHNPQTCWQGSGFTFDHVEMVITDGGYSFMIGKLKKENEVLYTSWWYDNGLTITADQWEWRQAVLAGEPPYYLLNLSMISKAELLAELGRVTPGKFHTQTARDLSSE
ncbi:MAG: exosortase N [Bacteroidota bacterium]